MDKILVFDVRGDFAHFRLPYTTSSSGTHLVPPRHTIAGMIGAILGVQREDVSKVFHPDNCKIGITNESRISQLRVTINQLLVKGNATLDSIMTVNQHSQIPFQLLKRVHYRIYFYHQDQELMDRLTRFLKHHECIYPPSLGLAQLLAQVEWFREIEKPDTAIIGKITTKSVAPLAMFNPKPDANTNHMVIDKQARHLDEKRQPDQYHRVVFDSIGQVPLSGDLITVEGPALPVVINQNQLSEVVFLW